MCFLEWDMALNLWLGRSGNALWEIYAKFWLSRVDSNLRIGFWLIFLNDSLDDDNDNDIRLNP